MPYGTLALDAIQTSGNLAITGNTIVTGNVTANTYNLVSRTLGTATPGRLEYNGTAPFFTPLGTQRGVIPGMQYYALNTPLVGTNATGAQNILGAGVTLSDNTFYAFDAQFNFYKNAGTTSHTFALQWGGTATLNNISVNILIQNSAQGYVTVNSARSILQYVQESTTAFVCTGAIASAFYTVNMQIQGLISVSTGGTFIPQYVLSAAPGGAYTTSRYCFMRIYPIGAAGANVNVGTWA